MNSSSLDQLTSSLVGRTLPLKEIRESALSDYFKIRPDEWIKRKLGEFLWSVQKKICASVVSHRRTAVYSCHRIGKSFLAARLAVWWIDTHKPGEAMVVTSSHSAMQVKAAIWREIGRVHAKGKLDMQGNRIPFDGRLNQAEWYMTMPAGNEELVAFGRKPADEDTTAFQGVYSRYILVLVDEACYIAKPLWEGMDTLLSNNDSRVVAWGNPDDPTTEFAEVCKPGSGWNVIRVGYDDTPNFTGEPVPEEVGSMLLGPTWVEEKRRKWGENNPLYISKVKGLFPEVTTDGLIPISWVRAAQERTIDPSTPNELGVDVGGGSDKSVIAHRRGSYVRIIHKDTNPNTMVLLGYVIKCLRETGASVAKVDYIGIGKGIVDRAQEITRDEPDNPNREYAAKVVGINVSRPCEDEKEKQEFINIRARDYWSLRNRAERGDLDLDPDDDDLAAQLIDLKWHPVSGRIKIESKEEIRADGRSSPDEADAVNLSFMKIQVKKKGRLTWGRSRQITNPRR